MNYPGDNADETGVGELNGVGDEIEQNLSKADGIGIHGLWDGAFAGDGELKVVREGSGGHDLPDLHHDSMGRTRSDVDWNPAANEACHIEGVVNETEDVPGAGPDVCEGGFARCGVR
ncbi:MAG: hypothetical protein AMXMBFR20_35280 [Planctomycetia bacterium]